MIRYIFENIENFFTYPCNSEDVEIYMVSSLAKKISCCSQSEIKRKYVLLPYKTLTIMLLYLCCISNNVKHNCLRSFTVYVINK